MGCLEKGFLGLNLRIQNFAIAIIQMVAAICLLAFASVNLAYPGRFVTGVANYTKNGSIIWQHNEDIKRVGERAILLLVGCLTTILACSFLLNGILKYRRKSLEIWCGITSFNLCACFIIFLFRVCSSSSAYGLKTSKIIAITLYLLLNIYFIVSVDSYIRVLRRRSALTKDIMIAARQGERFYDSDSNNLATFATPLSDMSNTRLEGDHRLDSAYVNGQRTVHTRKTVLDGSESDVTTDDDEFILYKYDDTKHIIR